jgi:hypothetical protein
MESLQDRAGPAQLRRGSRGGVRWRKKAPRRGKTLQGCSGRSFLILHHASNDLDVKSINRSMNDLTPRTVGALSRSHWLSAQIEKGVLESNFCAIC